MESVEVQEPGGTSLLTLMLKRLLDRSLQDPRMSRVMASRVLTVRVRTRKMATTLFFESDRILAEDGNRGRPDLEISGDLPSLLSLALGANPVRAVLARRLRVRPRSLRGWVYAPKLMRILRLG